MSASHVHFSPMFRDLAGRAITFPLMQSHADNAQEAFRLGEQIASEPRMGLELVGLATFPCNGDPMVWEPDGVHPALGYFRILAGPKGGFPNVTTDGRC